MDLFHKLTNWIDQNRWTALGIALVIALAALLASCASMTPSPIDPARRVTGQQLVQEVSIKQEEFDGKEADITAATAKLNAAIAAFNVRVQAAQEDLARQDALKAQAFQGVIALAGNLATGGPITPMGVVGSGITLLGALGAAWGLGRHADAKRKDSVIAELKATPTAGATDPTDPTNPSAKG